VDGKEGAGAGDAGGVGEGVCAVTMNPLRQQLCNFLMHEETPVDSILRLYGLEEVFQEIGSILNNETPDNIAHTLGFIRDANLYKHPFRESFREYLASASIWEMFRDLLKAPDFRVRQNTIYTIGKLTNRDRAYLLSDAFPHYLANDPINLPRLISEHLWLTNQWNWEWMEQLVSADHYLKRWSLCQILDDNGDDEKTKAHFIELLDRLKTDMNPLVASEANFQFERIKVKLGPKLPKAEWRKEVKRIASLEPKVLFERTALRFVKNRSDYTLDEFDQFVRNGGDEATHVRSEI
jgi:hypothetical protein